MLMSKGRPQDGPLDIDGVLEFVMARATEMGASYADARYQDRRLTLAGLTSRRSDPGAASRRDTWEVSRHVEKGLGVRVIGPSGGEGFSATSDFSRPALAAVVSEALAGSMSADFPGTSTASGAPPSAACRTPSRAARALGPPVVTTGRAVTPRTRHPEDVSLEEKKGLLETFAAEAFAIPETGALNLAYADSAGVDHLATTEGTRVETDTTRVILRAGVQAHRAPSSYDCAESLGGVGGLELLPDRAVKELARRLAAGAAEWLGAAPAPGGEMTTILDNQAGENFVHEAVGHSCEADAVLTGASVMAGKLGVQVGAPGVTVVDDPGRPGTVGLFPYDDEGVPAERVTLIEDGVLRNYLHTRRTAEAMGASPNGHARARDFGHLPIVRMGTINLEAGDFGLEELFEGVRDGIYLIGKRGGQVDPARGVFQFRPDRARLIRNGEPAEPVRAPSLSGSVLDILQNIDAVGDDLRFHPGGCGKGFPSQVIPAGSGSPHLRLRRATIGGTALGRAKVGRETAPGRAKVGREAAPAEAPGAPSSKRRRD